MTAFGIEQARGRRGEVGNSAIPAAEVTPRYDARALFKG